MSDLKHISSENKERLVKLVNKTASYVNTGMEPTDALVKAASESDYPTDYVLRAAEAYNGAAHLAYFKSAANDERGNSFSLADGAAAVARILNSADVGNKRAADAPFAYTSESNGYFDAGQIEDSFLFNEKKAAAPSFDELQKSAAALDKQEKLSVERYRNRYNEACENLATSIRYFKEKTASVSTYRRLHWVREMLERHGKQALDVISLATDVSGTECEKLASDKIGFYSLTDEHLSSLDSIVREFNQVNFITHKLAQAEHDAYVNSRERKQLLDDAAGIKRSNIAENVGALVSDINPLSDSDSIQKGTLESLVDPDFVNQSNRIDRALVLHKLMKTDPIIGSKQPQEIQQALSEITSMAPTAAKSEPLLRSMLRRRLEAGEQIDDFSLNQMLNMEDKMRDQYREYAVVPKLTGGDEKAYKPK
jgi:hypothetical protein